MNQVPDELVFGVVHNRKQLISLINSALYKRRFHGCWVYKLASEDGTYIGSTKDLPTRLKQHFQVRKAGALPWSVSLWYGKHSEFLLWEKLLIQSCSSNELWNRLSVPKTT